MSNFEQQYRYKQILNQVNVGVNVMHNTIGEGELSFTETTYLTCALWH